MVNLEMTLTAYFFLAMMSFLLLILPFRYAMVPMIVSICYMTLGQRVIISDLNFTLFRILIFIGFIRLLIRGEFYRININGIDKVLICWVAISVITATVLNPTKATFINRLGFAYNAIGAYFLFRFLFKDRESIYTLFKAMAIVILPLAIIMIIEKYTARNLFSVFGGVPDFTVIREGRLRSQGPFNHPILTGTFGASIFPFFIALWFQEKGQKFVAFIGVLSATVITIASASSGPVIAYIFGLAGFMAWCFRQHLRAVRWAMLLGLIGLHLYMKAPVWYLSARISEVIGGTGDHRSALITQAISHFNEWWLFGTNNTAAWMPYQLTIDPNNVDITNQYILEGVTGGLLKLILFIVLITFCFKKIGRTLQSLENEKFVVRITLWSMGVSLLVHTVSFFSVAYFDQMVVILYMLVAMISSSSGFLLKNDTAAPNPATSV